MKSYLPVNLHQFEIIDEGKKYLKIYHPQVYGRLEALGSIDRDQLGTINLQEYLKNAVIEEMSEEHDVIFQGQFVAPKVEKVVAVDSPKCAQCQATISEGKFCKAHAWIEKEPVTESIPESDLSLKFKQADTVRQASEFDSEVQMKNFTKEITDLTNETLAYLKKEELDSPKIKSIKEASDKKAFEVTASAIAGKGPITITFLVKHAEGKFEFPLTEDLNKNIEQAIPETTKVFEQAQKEAFQKMQEVDEGVNLLEQQTEAALRPVKKEASLSKQSEGTNTPRVVDYQSVLKLSKEVFPSSLEVGDVVYIEGTYYRLANKTENQLSQGKDDASYWVFHLVPPLLSEGIKPVYEVRNY